MEKKMKLDQYINTLNFTNELSEVNQLLSKAAGKITFWGGRVITLPGYKGCVSLDTLVSRINETANKRSKADDLTNQERIDGIEISKKLRKFYDVTDSKLSKRNCFTRLLNWIREFPIYPYGVRFDLEDGMTDKLFKGYKESKFLQEFGGGVKNSWGDYKNSDGRFYSPVFRIIARESDIREKLLNPLQAG